MREKPPLCCSLSFLSAPSSAGRKYPYEGSARLYRSESSITPWTVRSRRSTGRQVTCFTLPLQLRVHIAPPSLVFFTCTACALSEFFPEFCAAYFPKFRTEPPETPHSQHERDVSMSFSRPNQTRPLDVWPLYKHHHFTPSSIASHFLSLEPPTNRIFVLPPTLATPTPPLLIGMLSVCLSSCFRSPSSTVGSVYRTPSRHFS